MTAGYTRKKHPEQVRQALLDQAALLTAERGVANLTVQAVAEAAGVTKGGLFHHFPTKQALVDAMFRHLLDRMDGEIDELIAEDGETLGCFTRAYVAAAFAEPDRAARNPWVALTVSMLGDSHLTRQWTDWLAGRLERHRATDDGAVFEIVRFAADGAWFALMFEAGKGWPTDFSTLRARLIAMTRQGQSSPS